MADILDRIRQTLINAAPEIPVEALDRGLLHVRLEHGGNEFGYIAKRTAQVKAAQLGQQLRQGQTLSQAFTELGISRTTGYRLLNRKNGR